jgi:hypothetical protein
MTTAIAAIDTKLMTLAQGVAAIHAVWPAAKCRISYPVNGFVTIEENENGIQRCDVGFTIAVLFRR